MNIPAAPSKEDALAAAQQLLEPFSEFPFQAEVDKAVFLSLLFTLARRPQLPLAPLFAVKSPTPGTGKTLILEAASNLVLGFNPCIMSPINDSRGGDEEVRKRLTSILMVGYPFVVFDNCSKPVGDDVLNAFITQDVWSDRKLGKSETIRVCNRTTLAVTGNNLRIKADTVRRVMMLSLDAGKEFPETRSFKIKNLLQHISEHRGELLQAIYTIQLAHARAGYPEADEAQIGSFEEWGRVAAAPAIWLGYGNPLDSQKEAREDDPERERLTKLFEVLNDMMQGKSMTAGEIKADLESTLDPTWGLVSDRDQAKEILLAGGRGGELTGARVSSALRRYKNRIIDGRMLKVDMDASLKQAIFKIEKLEG
jgi:putative DNA primase/helicase